MDSKTRDTIAESTDLKLVAEKIEALLAGADSKAFIEALMTQDPEGLAKALQCPPDELRKIGFDAYKAAFELKEKLPELRLAAELLSRTEKK